MFQNKFFIDYHNENKIEVIADDLTAAKAEAVKHISLTNKDITITDANDRILSVSSWTLEKPVGDSSVELCSVANIGFYKQWLDK